MLDIIKEMAEQGQNLLAAKHILGSINTTIAIRDNCGHTPIRQYRGAEWSERFYKRTVGTTTLDYFERYKSIMLQMTGLPVIVMLKTFIL